MKSPIHSGGFTNKAAREIAPRRTTLRCGGISSAYHSMVETIYRFNVNCFQRKKVEEVMQVPVKKLRPDAVIPSYHKSGDAGFDLHCAEEVTIPPSGTALLPTGLAFAVPQGFEMQIRMRSGAALHTPLLIPNAPGTIDSGYRGEVLIIVRNTGPVPWTVNKGERIAQGVLAPVVKGEFRDVAELPSTSRGAGGFGSTGSM